jgi:hypothetical protein
MRNGQNKRMRGRHNNNNQRKNHHNPMSRVYESNGPDVKIRGTPSHIAEKYVQLARDAHTSGDPVSAENYYQHAEHYFRLIAAAQEQFRQANPHYQPPPQLDNSGARDDFDDGEDGQDGQQPMSGAGEAPFSAGEPQPYLPREAQPYQPRDQQQHQPQQQNYQQPQHNQQQHNQNHQQHQPRPHQQPSGQESGNVDRLPSFITGGQPQPQQGQPPQQGYGQNGHDNNQPDRFPLHRRRRRHRSGPRPDGPGGQPNVGGDDVPPHD